MSLQKEICLKSLFYLGLVMAISTAFAEPPKDLKPETFLLNADVLQASKSKIKQGDKTLIKALNELVNEADKTLTKGPYSYKPRRVGRSG